jgi:hypothetical protein
MKDPDIAISMSGYRELSAYLKKQKEKTLELDDTKDVPATPEDVHQAIGALSNTELYRIRKAAEYCLPGTEYQDPQEIINEAIVRTMNAASGQKGTEKVRRWPKSVPFIAYMIRTVQGLANDSQESSFQKRTDYMEAMATETASAEDVLGRHKNYHIDVLNQALDLEETSERQDRAKEIVSKIDAYFAGDSEVTWVIMGHKDRLPVREILELSEMTHTQYETARKRFRRGLNKLFPEKRKS